MPEGDTIYRTARTLNRALAGGKVKSFQTVLPKLARVDVDHGVVGRTVQRVEAQGKWLKMDFSGDLILLTHMLMSGSWHIYRPGEAWKRPRIDQRITIATEEFVAVAFKVPIAEFHTAATLERRLRWLGPSILAEELDEPAVLANLRGHAGAEVGAVLLNQSVLAGIGNVFKSEVCFECDVNPFRQVNSLTIQEAACLVATARRFMLANVDVNSGDKIVTHGGMRRTTGLTNTEERLWVYHRSGKPCRRCGTKIERRKQMPDARVTFWCPSCQPRIKSGEKHLVASAD